MTAPHVITSPTCKFKTKRKGFHKPIFRGNDASGYVCLDCWFAMRASYNTIFNGGPVFCHECGNVSNPGDLFAFVHRDTESMILCEPCNARHIVKIRNEQAAIASAKDALVIHSTDARTLIAEAKTPEKKQTLYQRFKEMFGTLRRAK